MAQTALTTTVLTQDNVAVAAAQLAVVPVAGDAVNGNSFVSTGREILFAQNSGASAYTLTVNSQPDALGRSDASLTAYSIPAGGFAFIQMKYQSGWVANGLMTVLVSNAALKLAVLQYN
jgi:hypothetical protein